MYSIQRKEAWEEALKKGYLIGNIEYIDPWYKKSYDWMKEQMKKKGIELGKEEYPIWLWLDINNIHIGELIEEDYVLLEINIDTKDKSKVLISNFCAWHVILNEGYFEVENDWEVIFDKERLYRNGYTYDEDDLQGVTGRIDIEDIRIVKYIVNRI